MEKAHFDKTEKTLPVGSSARPSLRQETSPILAFVPQQPAGNLATQRAFLGGGYNGAVIQRKCDCGGTCPDCEEEMPQRKPEDFAFVAPRGLELSLQLSSGAGLDNRTRSFMESRFGQDFSGVRVHTDTHAAGAARKLHAKAFTTGRHVYFGAGRYEPQTPEGRGLLAHELTHVVQQRNGAVRPGSAKLEVNELGDSYEREADDVAMRVMGDPSTETVSASNIKATGGIQRAPDGPSIWDTFSQGAKNAGAAAFAGASSIGSAVVQGVRDTGSAIVQNAQSAGTALVQGAKSAAAGVASAGADLLELEEKRERLKTLLKDYSPLPEGLIRLKDNMVAEKDRLTALGQTVKPQAASALPNQVVAQIAPAGGAAGAAGGGGTGGPAGQPAGGCGLCYGNEPGAVGPREAGSAAHRVIQNMMITEPGVMAEFPFGNGRIDLAVVHPDRKEIEIGEIKPANEKGIDDGIKQIEGRLRTLPTLTEYAGYRAVPLKYPVRQPLPFDTYAPFCLEQPGYCFSQKLLVAGPIAGLYPYFCEPSYSELIGTGCKCKCKERERDPFRLPFPIGVPVQKREKKAEETQPEAVNWAKVASIALIIAMALIVIAALICTFATTATVVGIPVAVLCAGAAAAAAVALIVLVTKVKDEPDTMA